MGRDHLIRSKGYGKMAVANQSFARMIGYTREELSYKSHRDFTPAEYQELRAREVTKLPEREP